MNSETRIKLLEDVKALVGEHCNAFIFIANVDAEEKPDDTETIINHWEGGRAHCLGLMAVVQETMQADVRSEHLGESE